MTPALSRPKAATAALTPRRTQAPGRLFLVLEFCAGGDLAAWLAARPHHRAGEAPASHFLRHLARGLAELRRLHVVHRDLKPHNLLLVPAPERDGRERERDPATGAPLPTLKIADFGFATRLPGAELAETLCGSPLYMARAHAPRRAPLNSAAR